MAAGLSIAARMALWVVLASWQADSGRSIGGAGMHADSQPSARSGAENERASGQCGSAWGNMTGLGVD